MARKIGKEEVVEKLKDDGDFDRLRLKIIRRLKENVTPLSLAPLIRVCGLSIVDRKQDNWILERNVI